MASGALPWTDASGRLSALKAVVFAATLAPGVLIAAALATGNAGPRPYDFAVHETGEWTVRFLLASLAVTPLRRILDWGRLIQVRRMLGLAALSYALAHFALYVIDQQFNLVKVASEIVLRVYLTIGFAALLGLVALGVTSTDAAIRRMGRAWSRLHRIVYAIGVLGLLHYFMQTKLDVALPTFYAGLFLLLMGYRAAHAAGWTLSAPVLAVIAVLGAAATMGVEYAWFASATNVPADRVFLANFTLAGGVRPAWWVGLAGLAVAAAAFARGGLSGTRTAAPRVRRAPAG